MLVTHSCPTLCDPMDCSPPGSMEFSRQESWSGLPFPSPGDLPHPGIQPGYPALQADSLLSEPPGGSKLAALHTAPACLHAKLLQSCLSLCDPMDHSPPGSSVHGILQARTLEWVAISSSRGSSQPRFQTHVSYVSCIGRWILYHWCLESSGERKLTLNPC